MTTSIVLRRGRFSARIKRRAAVTASITLLVGLALSVLGLALGDYDISLAEVVSSFLGTSDDAMAHYFVTQLRAPRVVAALWVGAALGVAGAMFQNITGNPLGSPDIIGFTTGAATGALLQIIVFGGTGAAIATGALVGGLATAGLVHLLVGRGGLTGQRLVLVGIGVGATLAALNTLLVVRASLESAQQATHWMAGSLNAMLWPKVNALALAVGLLCCVGLTLAKPLQALVLGDDAARAVGVSAQSVRTRAVLVAVALVSVATAATGPIAFVALAAPQVARRIAGQPVPGLFSSAVTGAVLVLASDLAAQHAFAGTELAVGVVTGALGGVYLIGLLALEWRKR